MLVVAFILVAIISFVFGYKLRDVFKRVEKLEATIKAKVDKPVEEKPKSEFIDPLDEVAEAQYEHKKMMDKLNGR